MLAVHLRNVLEREIEPELLYEGERAPEQDPEVVAATHIRGYAAVRHSEQQGLRVVSYRIEGLHGLYYIIKLLHIDAELFRHVLPHFPCILYLIEIERSGYDRIPVKELASFKPGLLLHPFYHRPEDSIIACGCPVREPHKPLMPPPHIYDLEGKLCIGIPFFRELREDRVHKLQAPGAVLYAGPETREVGHRPEVFRVGELFLGDSHC